MTDTQCVAIMAAILKVERPGMRANEDAIRLALDLLVRVKSSDMFAEVDLDAPPIVPPRTTESAK